MENERLFTIPLDSPLDVNMDDQGVSVERPTFTYNRQKKLGGLLQTSARYEADGWFAGWWKHEFVLVSSGLNWVLPDWKGRTPEEEAEAEEFYKDAADNVVIRNMRTDRGVPYYLFYDRREMLKLHINPEGWTDWFTGRPYEDWPITRGPQDTLNVRGYTRMGDAFSVSANIYTGQQVEKSFWCEDDSMACTTRLDKLAVNVMVERPLVKADDWFTYRPNGRARLGDGILPYKMTSVDRENGGVYGWEETHTWGDDIVVTVDVPDYRYPEDATYSLAEQEDDVLFKLNGTIEHTDDMRADETIKLKGSFNTEITIRLTPSFSAEEVSDRLYAARALTNYIGQLNPHENQMSRQHSWLYESAGQRPSRLRHLLPVWWMFKLECFTIRASCTNNMMRLCLGTTVQRGDTDASEVRGAGERHTFHSIGKDSSEHLDCTWLWRARVIGRGGQTTVPAGTPLVDWPGVWWTLGNRTTSIPFDGSGGIPLAECAIAARDLSGGNSNDWIMHIEFEVRVIEGSRMRMITAVPDGALSSFKTLVAVEFQQYVNLSKTNGIVTSEIGISSSNNERDRVITEAHESLRLLRPYSMFGYIRTTRGPQFGMLDRSGAWPYGHRATAMPGETRRMAAMLEVTLGLCGEGAILNDISYDDARAEITLNRTPDADTPEYTRIDSGVAEDLYSLINECSVHRIVRNEATGEVTANVDYTGRNITRQLYSVKQGTGTTYSNNAPAWVHAFYFSRYTDPSTGSSPLVSGSFYPSESYMESMWFNASGTYTTIDEKLYTWKLPCVMDARTLMTWVNDVSVPIAVSRQNNVVSQVILHKLKPLELAKDIGTVVTADINQFNRSTLWPAVSETSSDVTKEELTDKGTKYTVTTSVGGLDTEELVTYLHSEVDQITGEYNVYFERPINDDRLKNYELIEKELKFDDRPGALSISAEMLICSIKKVPLTLKRAFIIPATDDDEEGEGGIHGFVDRSLHLQSQEDVEATLALRADVYEEADYECIGVIDIQTHTIVKSKVFSHIITDQEEDGGLRYYVAENNTADVRAIPFGMFKHNKPTAIPEWVTTERRVDEKDSYLVSWIKFYGDDKPRQVQIDEGAELNVAYLTEDIREGGECKRVHRNSLKDARQFIKQQWSDDNEVENFWWASDTVIMRLTKDRIELLEKVTREDENGIVEPELTDWGGDKWKVVAGCSRANFFDTDDIYYGMSCARLGNGTEQAVLFKISAGVDYEPNFGSDAGIIRIEYITDITNPKEYENRFNDTVDKYGNPVHRPYWTPAEIRVYTTAFGETLPADAISAYVALNAEAIVSGSKISATAVDGRFMIGFAYTRGLAQWTAVIEKGATRQGRHARTP